LIEKWLAEALVAGFISGTVGEESEQLLLAGGAIGIRSQPPIVYALGANALFLT
jgi:hypothetical protein